MEWLQKEIPDQPTAIYVVDDPSAPLHPPKNKGHEVMVYLTYIIDHYDELADVTMFMHAHQLVSTDVVCRTWSSLTVFSLGLAQRPRPWQ